MPAKSEALLFTFLVCSVVWATGVQLYGTGEEQHHQLYAEIKKNSFENFDEEIVQPEEVSENGYPLVNIRVKRDVQTNRKRHFFFAGFGKNFQLDVEPESNLLATRFKVYHLNGNGTSRSENIREDLEKCLFRGKIKHYPLSAVALNLCGGMTGMLKTEDSEYLIEPAGQSSKDTQKTEGLHVLKKRSAAHSTESLSETKDNNQRRNQKFFCGKKRRYMPHRPRRKDHWLPEEFEAQKSKNASVHDRVKRRVEEQSHLNGGRGYKRRHQRKSRRSVETLVVADREMVKKHGTENVTTYLLTVFNMVAMLYQDSSIGSNVSVILVGLVLLEGDEPGLSLSHNAENSLNSFCQWQSTIFTSKGRQHDHAVLVTGLDICSWKNEPCDTLGYAPISGMCSKYRSCTVNEDSGLALAFTVAHEIGHNFGMVHDGQGSSPCRRKRGTLMSESLSGLDTSVLWSDCSRRDLAKFLEYGLPPQHCVRQHFESPRSLCLKNEPDSPDELQFPNHLPGQLYDADMQCRLQFGTKSRLCEHYPRKNEVCRALWCQRNGRECETKFLPAAEGTPCGDSKWCRKGVCADREMETMRTVDGGWSSFTPWSSCTRSCGGGLMIRERFCDSPLPSNGGNYCKGEEKEFKICNAQECEAENSKHLADQCATFNKRTVKGKLYRWRPYGKDLGALSRCRIYCVPAKEDMYLILSTKLQDGTSCSGNYSSVCVEGECRAVGCNGKVESSVVPDRCGVCSGDNSTCKTVKGTFKASNLSAGYHEVVKIPSQSRHINVAERRDSPSYLALKNDVGLYYFNGNWTLDWPGRYNAAGTDFSYRRWTGKPESFATKGPTNENLIVEVLVQEVAEVTIHYEFVISLMQHRWERSNSSCSVSCGNGTLVSSAICVNHQGHTVDDMYCEETKKPPKESHTCNENLCQQKWEAGVWSSCNSNPCVSGLQTREVYCSLKGLKVSNSKCEGLDRPASIRECSRTKCNYTWFTGPWSKCRGKCSSGFQTRSITCRRNKNATAESFSNCNEESQPPHMRKCRSDNCSTYQLLPKSTWMTSTWSECKGKCGEEMQHRNVTCITNADGLQTSSSSCSSDMKPSSKQNCSSPKCENSKMSNCEDSYHWCTTSINTKLCKLKFYSINCCNSCKTR